jgi:purine-nucleoside phosphorylase
MISIFDRATEAARFIYARSAGKSPRVAVTLGSGLGGVAGCVQDSVEIPYEEIPYFVKPTVDGHAGTMIVGNCSGVDVVLMRGRFHFYEGYSMEEVTLPIRVFAAMGIKSLILTNAAGGVSSKLSPGSLMAITDHINMMGENPLRGPNDARFGERFPDMTAAYEPAYLTTAHEVALQIGVKLEDGVYMALRGPSYETPAEIRMLRTLGADAVGMSTVPEVIVARHSGIRVLAISCITNIAAGLAPSQINHAEVIEVGARAGIQLADLIVKIIPRIT